MTSPQGPLAWLLGFSDPERGVGWNPRASPDPFWKPGRTRALLDLAGAPGLLRPLLRRAVRVWTAAADEPRATPPDALAAIIGRLGRRAEPATSVASALAAARASGAPLVVVAGSLRVVTEAREALGLAPQEEPA